MEDQKKKNGVQLLHFLVLISKDQLEYFCVAEEISNFNIRTFF